MKTTLLLLFATAALLLTVGTSDQAHAQAESRPQPIGASPEFDGLIGDLVGILVEPINGMVRLDEPLIFTNRNCGEANAFFMQGDTPSGHAEIVLCNELVRDIVIYARSSSSSEAELGITIVSQIFFVLGHETGHALIRMLDLPITGHEEDVADQFAALIFEQEPIMAIQASRFFSDRASSATRSAAQTEAAFADDHSLSEQRVYDLLCAVYGADPETRTYVLQALPTARAAGCGDAYERSRRGFISLLTPHLKDSADETFGDLAEARDLSGTWSFTESISAQGARCSAGGQFTIMEFADEFFGDWSQTGRCSANGRVVDNTSGARITGGVVDHEAGSLSFTVDSCEYTGEFADESMMQLQGQVSCNGGNASGTWSAVRQ